MATIEDFQSLLNAVIDIMRFRLTIWNFDFTFWQIFCWSVGCAAVFKIVGFALGGQWGADDD